MKRDDISWISSSSTSAISRSDILLTSKLSRSSFQKPEESTDILFGFVSYPLAWMCLQYHESSKRPHGIFA